MSGYYKDKVVLVTGGNSGIGRELVRQLAAEGAVLELWGRNAETGKSLVAEVSSTGGNIHFHTVDVQDAQAVETAMSDLMQRHGRLDFVFHCAGVIVGGEARDHNVDDISQVMRTNVLGTAYVAFYSYRLMARQGSGHLVLISSGAGIFPVPLMGFYSASKFAVSGVSEALRMEGAALGVRVSAVSPGLVDTPLYDRAHYSNTDKAKAMELLKKRIYMIQPDRAARTILRGTRRNKAVIHTQAYVRLSWMLYRLTPHAFRFFAGQAVRVFRRRYRAGG